MNFFEKLGDAIIGYWNRVKPKGKNTFTTICAWFFRLRSIFLCVPVVAAAVILAMANGARLPAQMAVRFPGFSQSGQLVLDTYMVTRSAAVGIPLFFTGVCVLMMFLSRRTVYPWIASVLTLILPLFLYFITVFPG